MELPTVCSRYIFNGNILVGQRLCKDIKISIFRARVVTLALNHNGRRGAVRGVCIFVVSIGNGVVCSFFKCNQPIGAVRVWNAVKDLYVRLYGASGVDVIADGQDIKALSLFFKIRINDYFFRGKYGGAVKLCACCVFPGEPAYEKLVIICRNRGKFVNRDSPFIGKLHGLKYGCVILVHKGDNTCFDCVGGRNHSNLTNRGFYGTASGLCVYRGCSRRDCRRACTCGGDKRGVGGTGVRDHSHTCVGRIPFNRNFIGGIRRIVRNGECVLGI